MRKADIIAAKEGYERQLSEYDTRMLQALVQRVAPGQLKDFKQLKGIAAERKFVAHALYEAQAAEQSGKTNREQKAENALYRLFDVELRQYVRALWWEKQLLPLSPAYHAVHGTAPVAAGASVKLAPGAAGGADERIFPNPTVWPSARPYREIATDTVGLEQPWQTLSEFMFGCPALHPFCDNYGYVEVAGGGCNGPLQIFAAAAGALRAFTAAGALQVQLDVGDVVCYARRCDRADAGSDCAAAQDSAAAAEQGRFDRIHLNNVPDYTSMLPVLTELVPQLKAHCAAWLTHNCLVNTPQYTQAAEYTYGWLLAHPGPTLEALLGARCLWGTVWHHDFAWQRCDAAAGPLAAPPRFDGRLTPEKVCSWLRALLVHAAMPHVREYNVAVLFLPCSMAAWWRIVEVVASRVPPHWLSALLNSVLWPASLAHCNVPRVEQRGNEPTRAPLGTWPAADTAPEVWDLGLLGAEAEALAALSAPKLPRALLAPGIAAAFAGGDAAGGTRDELVLFELPVDCESVQPSGLCRGAQVLPWVAGMTDALSPDVMARCVVAPMRLRALYD